MAEAPNAPSRSDILHIGGFVAAAFLSFLLNALLIATTFQLVGAFIENSLEVARLVEVLLLVTPNLLLVIYIARRRQYDVAAGIVAGLVGDIAVLSFLLYLFGPF